MEQNSSSSFQIRSTVARINRLHTSHVPSILLVCVQLALIDRLDELELLRDDSVYYDDNTMLLDLDIVLSFC